MRVVVQRVRNASVTVNGELISSIDTGLLALVGAVEGDGVEDVNFFVRKLAGLRIFEDETGKMNCNVTDAGGAVLIVSQFTLAAETASGNRPSFTNALSPEPARELVDELVQQLSARGIRVAKGVFGAAMDVALVNDGPVTIILDSQRKK